MAFSRNAKPPPLLELTFFSINLNKANVFQRLTFAIEWKTSENQRLEEEFKARVKVNSYFLEFYQLIVVNNKNNFLLLFWRGG